ncbi:MAG: hypothetical protein AAGJ18_23815 [Bacteroidota bacterium]
MTTKRIKKAYIVYHTIEADQLDMPWAQVEEVKIEEGQSKSRAISQVANLFDCTFLELSAQRRPRNDVYLVGEEEMSKHVLDYRIAHQKWVNKMTDLVDNHGDQKCYIKSGQWHAYWRPNRCGYTEKQSEAGVYTVKEAWAATSHCGLEKKISFELIEELPANAE